MVGLYVSLQLVVVTDKNSEPSPKESFKAKIISSNCSGN